MTVATLGIDIAKTVYNFTGSIIMAAEIRSRHPEYGDTVLVS
jgi:hypothetical protein